MFGFWELIWSNLLFDISYAVKGNSKVRNIILLCYVNFIIGEFECPYVKVSRCCGLKITSEGYVVTLAKNNHHVLVLNTLYIS